LKEERKNTGIAVACENVTKTYGNQEVLRGITLQVPTGRVLGLLGPNGAGKSTTLRILAGSLAPDSGSVRVFGQPMDPTDVRFRDRIGFLQEHNPLYPEMYVVEFLTFVARLHRLSRRRERIHDVIERTGLGPERHKRISQLSKGYRQRVGIAQAIIHDPEIVILDEPTSGLDPNQLVEVRRLIRELGKEKAVLLSTHIMSEVEAVCDDAAIMHQGAIVAQLAIDQLAIDKNPYSSGPVGIEEIFTRLTRP